MHDRYNKFVVNSSQIMIHQCADALCHQSMNDHNAEQRSSYHVTNKLRELLPNVRLPISLRENELLESRLRPCAVKWSSPAFEEQAIPPSALFFPVTTGQQGNVQSQKKPG